MNTFLSLNISHAEKYNINFVNYICNYFKTIIQILLKNCDKNCDRFYLLNANCVYIRGEINPHIVKS